MDCYEGQGGFKHDKFSVASQVHDLFSHFQLVYILSTPNGILVYLDT